MFEFAWPWVFILIPLPLVVYLVLSAKHIQDNAIRVPFYQQAISLGQTSPGGGTSGLLQKLLLVLAWLTLLAAAARPQWVGEAIQMPAEGRDLLLAVDISGSMEMDDMRIDNRQLRRIEVVKYVVSDFVARRESDRLGLILFGTQAYLQTPLTFDRTTVGELLQEAQLGFAGQKTAIGDAIGLAIKRLRDRPVDSRVLILLTDGANTAGEVDPRKAAELAKLADIKIYTIGVGADEMIENTIFGRRQINPSSDLDETTLEFIAEHTGGEYFRAKSPEDLIRVYQRLDELEPIEQNDAVFRPVSPLFMWPFGVFLFLSFLLGGLRIDWRRYISPSSHVSEGEMKS